MRDARRKMSSWRMKAKRKWTSIWMRSHQDSRPSRGNTKMKMSRRVKTYRICSRMPHLIRIRKISRNLIPPSQIQPCKRVLRVQQEWLHQRPVIAVQHPKIKEDEQNLLSKTQEIDQGFRVLSTLKNQLSTSISRKVYDLCSMNRPRRV